MRLGELCDSSASSSELGGADGKQREGRERLDGGPELSGERRAAEEGALDTLRQHRHVEVGGGTRRHAWKPVEAGRWRELPTCNVQHIYRIATRFIFQITFKFVW